MHAYMHTYIYIEMYRFFGSMIFPFFVLSERWWLNIYVVTATISGHANNQWSIKAQVPTHFPTYVVTPTINTSLGMVPTAVPKQ